MKMVLSSKKKFDIRKETQDLGEVSGGGIILALTLSMINNLSLIFL